MHPSEQGELYHAIEFDVIGEGHPGDHHYIARCTIGYHIDELITVVGEKPHVQGIVRLQTEDLRCAVRVGVELIIVRSLEHHIRVDRATGQECYKTDDGPPRA